MRKQAAILFFFITMLVMMSCVPAQMEEPPGAVKQSEPAKGGTLHIGIASLDIFDPLRLRQEQAVTPDWSRLVYRSLMSWDDTRGWIPDLAERVDFDEANHTMMIHLKKDLRWQDGQPLTVKDVLFSLGVYLDPFYYGQWKTGLSEIQGSGAFRSGKPDRLQVGVDEKTGRLRITVEQVKDATLHFLQAPILPAHQLAGKSVETIARLMGEGQVTGSGPFKIAEKNTEHLLLSKAFPDAPQPYLDAIDLIAVPTDQLNDAVDAKHLDLAFHVPGQLDNLSVAGHDEKLPGAGFQYIGFPTDKPPFDKKENRLLLAQSLDRKQLITKALLDQAVPVDGVFPPTARFTLEQPKTSIVDKTVPQETIRLIYPQGNPLWQRLADEAARQLQEKGWNIETKPVQQAQYIDHLFSGSADYDLFLYSWQFEEWPSGLYQRWASGQTSDKLGYNMVKWRNPQVDKSLASAVFSWRTENWRRQLQQFQSLFYEEQPIVPLASLNRLLWVRDGVQGIDLSRGVLDVDEADKWWLKTIGIKPDNAG
jgi:peptide/nickel transport system substrate-binding protein